MAAALILDMQLLGLSMYYIVPILDFSCLLRMYTTFALHAVRTHCRESLGGAKNDMNTTGCADYIAHLSGLESISSIFECLLHLPL